MFSLDVDKTANSAAFKTCVFIAVLVLVFPCVLHLLLLLKKKQTKIETDKN